MSKRGLSNEEKRKRMLDFFFEKQDFFQLKDIEKMVPVEKGIVLQSVKDILTSLVDDGLVDSEKIGTSVYYWALPSKALNNREQTVKKAEQEMEYETQRNKELNQELEKYQQSQDNEKELEQLENELDELLKHKQKLSRELEAYKDNDPQVYEQMKQSIEVSKKACNRWVENIYSLKSWLKNKFRIDESVIDKQFEIPTDLDYY
jgi:DNA repair exonuclease SbcCD ATPase subunit